MKRIAIVLFVIAAVAATIPLLGRMAHLPVLLSSSPHKVFVVLGFHTNFYHSWRGDTPDEAGFGTDMRVVRGILRILDEANERGSSARGYWESDVQFTLESILPEYAPDILDGIRRRVEAGRDEVLVAPYNNGMFSAMTEDEVRAALRWAVSNPRGSGVRDLFGRFAPIVRPQEAMFTPGLIPLLLDEGMEGVVLPYSSYPFTSFTNFVPVLPPQQRYGVTRLRSRSDGPQILLLPSVSLGDVVDFVSLEKWMLDLREMQLDGTVDSDLVIHLNFDADAETWLPVDMPFGLGWVPNTGGLREYIDAVDGYDWAEFAVPSEIVNKIEPVGEVVVDRDTADGAWDGYFSWTEKHGSQEVWTRVQQSRMYEQQAREIAATLPGGAVSTLRETYFAGRDGSFFQRIRALSTTHFGMSNPMVNEQRFAVAMEASGGARDRALQALRSAARARAAAVDVQGEGDVVYAFEITATGRPATAAPLRIPVLLPDREVRLELVDAADASVPFALVDTEVLDGRLAGDLLVAASAAARPQPLRLRRNKAAAAPTDGASARTRILRNDRLQLALSTANGVDSLLVGDVRVGGPEFLTSFVTYRTDADPVRYWANEWSLETPGGEIDGPYRRARLRNRVPIDTPDGRVAAEVRVDWTLPDDASFVVADVFVDYPYTEKRDVLSTPMQKLRMLLDSRWIEVAPFQVHPYFDAEAGEELRVWRENYLGVVGGFALDYASVNPANANIDAFNHQVTGPWVAVTGADRGLLLAQSTPVRTSAAFAPMRLRTDERGRQGLWINPFGSYFGEQMDYSHMGGKGIGVELAKRIGPAFRPNGPSFNGQSAHFSLLLAPFVGAEPPADLQDVARTFFEPPAVVYVRTPEGVSARVEADMKEAIDGLRRRIAARSDAPLPAPRAFLASPTREAVDLVWDEAEDARIDGFEIEWRAKSAVDWQSATVSSVHRYRVENLVDGVAYEVRIRGLGANRQSDWSPVQEVVAGPVGEQSPLEFLAKFDGSLALRLAHQVLIHVATVP